MNTVSVAPMKSIFVSLVLAISLFNRASADEPAQLPPVTVTENQLTEELPVGPYQQPAWTTARRFSTTRVYLQQPPWGVGVEQWWRGRFLRGGDSKHLFQEEVEIGLPHRFQLDLYENWQIDEAGHVDHHDVAVELRWALADWGQIPLNPTLYGEWKFVDGALGPDVYEVKLLLGEELVPRWHWGFNIVYEQEVGGGRATEWAASQGISYTLLDEKLSIGVEMKYVNESEEGSRSDAENKFLIGPSVQWRPTLRSHVDIVPLFGATDDSPHVEAFVILGFDFGAGKEPSAPLAPASTRSQ